MPVDDTLASLRRLPQLAADADTAAVTRRLSGAIALGVLADGERLPAGEDLAAMLGCPLDAALNALARLERAGLVRTTDAGVLARRPQDPVLAAGRDRLGAVGVHELREIADQHTAVAGTAARLAAERAAGPELAVLRELAGEFAAATSAADRRRLDGRLHVELAAAAQSSRLTRQEIALQDEIGELRWLPGAEAVPPAEEAEHHRVLLEAISAGAGERARHLAELHVRTGIHRLVEHHQWIAAAGGAR